MHNFQNYTDFITTLIAQFDQRFRDFEMLKKDLILYENLRNIPIVEQSIDLQLELCDLQNNISLKSWSETDIHFF